MTDLEGLRLGGRVPTNEGRRRRVNSKAKPDRGRQKLGADVAAKQAGRRRVKITEGGRMAIRAALTGERRYRSRTRGVQFEVE